MVANRAGDAALETSPCTAVLEARRVVETARTVIGDSGAHWPSDLAPPAPDAARESEDHQRVPPMVDYTMTPFGLTLAEALMPLCMWGTEHRAEVDRVAGLTSSSRDHAGEKPLEHAVA